MKITVDACKCDLCGHVWLPEKGLPERCAKCKRFGWNAGEKTKGEKIVRTTGKNQKLLKQMNPKRAKKIKAGAASSSRGLAKKAGTPLGTGADTITPLDGGSPPNSPDAVPALSRECKLGAHAGCKDCPCACHAK